MGAVIPPAEGDPLFFELFPGDSHFRSLHFMQKLFNERNSVYATFEQGFLLYLENQSEDYQDLVAVITKIFNHLNQQLDNLLNQQPDEHFNQQLNLIRKLEKDRLNLTIQYQLARIETRFGERDMSVRELELKEQLDDIYNEIEYELRPTDDRRSA